MVVRVGTIAAGRKTKSRRLSTSRYYHYDVDDVAVAFLRAVEKTFGKDAILGTPKPFLKIFERGRNPVSNFFVTIGPNETTLGVMGFLMIRDLSATFDVGPQGKPVVYAYNYKEEETEAIENLLQLVQKELEENSIYRRKAIVLRGVVSDLGFGRSGWNIERDFLSLENVTEKGVVYNQRVQEDLEAHLWVPIEEERLCADIGAPQQHKVLLAGSWGSGKSLTARITAARAIKCGWTVFFVEPSAAEASTLIPAVLKFARIYLPALIVIEDIDHEDRHDNKHAFQKILSAVDGVETKDLKMTILMTTNDPSNIPAPMQRPGRIDKIIKLDQLETEDIVRILKEEIAPEFLDPEIEWNMVALRCVGFSQAFIHNVGKSAKFLAVRDAKKTGGPPVVRSEHLIRVAEDMVTQHKACAKPPATVFQSRS